MYCLIAADSGTECVLRKGRKRILLQKFISRAWCGIAGTYEAMMSVKWSCESCAAVDIQNSFSPPPDSSAWRRQGLDTALTLATSSSTVSDVYNIDYGAAGDCLPVLQQCQRVSNNNETCACKKNCMWFHLDHDQSIIYASRKQCYEDFDLCKAISSPI